LPRRSHSRRKNRDRNAANAWLSASSGDGIGWWPYGFQRGCSGGSAMGRERRSLLRARQRTLARRPGFVQRGDLVAISSVRRLRSFPARGGRRHFPNERMPPPNPAAGAAQQSGQPRLSRRS
jgi:hypothetical protein